MDDVVPFDINLRSPDTLLHVVVADERLSKRTTLRCVRELLARGADPRLPNDVGLTPLMSAAALGDLRVVSELVPLSDLEARGRHPNGFIGAPVRPGQEARTACEWAEFYGHAEVVSALNPGDGAKKKKRELYCLQDNCIYDRRNVGEMVCCDTCGTWIHTECARIPLSVFRDLARRSSSKYECPICADCRRRRREAGEPCE